MQQTNELLITFQLPFVRRAITENKTVRARTETSEPGGEQRATRVKEAEDEEQGEQQQQEAAKLGKRTREKFGAVRSKDKNEATPVTTEQTYQRGGGGQGEKDRDWKPVERREK